MDENVSSVCLEIPLGPFIEQQLRSCLIDPVEIIHVGAHKGEEVNEYLRIGFQHITLVEPQPDLADSLRMRFTDHSRFTVIESACGSVYGTFILNLLRDSQLASLLEPLPASSAYDLIGTVEVPVVRLQDVIDARTNVVVVDTQGGELDVVEGYDGDTVDLFILEARNGGRYVGAADVATTLAYMDARGWKHVGTLPHGPAARANVFDLAFIRKCENE